MKDLQQFINEQLSCCSDCAWIFTIIKPGFSKYSQQIIKEFELAGWNLHKVITKRLTVSQAKDLYNIHKGKPFYDDLCEYMASDLCTAIIYQREDMKVSKEMFEQTNNIKEKIRKRFGKDDMRNCMHSSDNLSAMEHETSIFF